MITAHEVYDADFRRAGVGTAGYDEIAVDDFLDRVILTLVAIERAEPLPAQPVTSHEVVETEFPERSANVDGGYDLDDVDDLLDRVAQRLFAAESERGAAPAAGVGGVSDESATSSEGVRGPEPVTGDVDDEPSDGGVADAAALAEASGAPRVTPEQDDRASEVMGAAEASDGGVADAEALAVASGAPLGDDHASEIMGAAEAPIEGGESDAHEEASVHDGAMPPVAAARETDVDTDAHEEDRDERQPGGINPVGSQPLDESAETHFDHHDAPAADGPVHAVGSDPEVDTAAEHADAQHDDTGTARTGEESHLDAEGETAESTERPSDDEANPPARSMGQTWNDGVDAPVTQEPVAADEMSSTAATAPAQQAPVALTLPSPVVDLPDVADIDESRPEPPIVSYPATDHRVPLPRNDARRSVSEEDREAEAQYHPEFSAYSTPDEPFFAVRDDDEVQRVVPSGADAEPSKVMAANEESAGTPPQLDTPTPGNPPAAVAAELAAREKERAAARDRLVSVEPSDAGSGGAESNRSGANSDIGRPAPIDAPEPLDAVTKPEAIDAPKPLPARDDTSRKGILRRIFKG